METIKIKSYFRYHKIDWIYWHMDWRLRKIFVLQDKQRGGWFQDIRVDWIFYNHRCFDRNFSKYISIANKKQILMISQVFQIMLNKLEQPEEDTELCWWLSSSSWRGSLRTTSNQQTKILRQLGTSLIMPHSPHHHSGAEQSSSWHVLVMKQNSYLCSRCVPTLPPFPGSQPTILRI